jgi:hypothetical protein
MGFRFWKKKVKPIKISGPNELYLDALLRNTRTLSIYRVTPSSMEEGDFNLKIEVGKDELIDGDKLVFIEDDKL